MTLEVGGAAETVNVSAESPLIQAHERRAIVRGHDRADREPADQPQQFHERGLADARASSDGGASAGGTRLGGAGQNNIMMDGVSAMDTGNNGQMLNMNVESIAEVKVLTQGYQAEYGRSSGLQITAVTKSGTNRFRGSAYDIQRDSDWNTNSWVNEQERRSEADGDGEDARATRSAVRSASRAATTSCSSSTATSTARRTTATNGGNPIRLRVPTALEREGDFSQTPRQQRRADPAAARSRPARGSRCSEQRDPGKIRQPVLLARPGDPEPLSAAEPHADAGHELQLRDRRRRARSEVS